MDADRPEIAEKGGTRRSGYFASVGLALIVLALSLAGLLVGERVYPDHHLATTFQPNDATNLILVLPVLVWSLFRRHHLLGRYVWTAALLTVSYNSLVASMSFGFGWQLLVHTALVVLSAGTALRLLVSIHTGSPWQSLDGRVAAFWSGGLLALFGAFFALRAAWMLIAAQIPGPGLPQTETALLLADLLFGCLWAAGGGSLVLRRPLGYSLGGVCLLQTGLLFLGLVVFLLLEPVFGGKPMMVEDLFATLVMSAVFAIPVGLFISGVLRTDRPRR